LSGINRCHQTSLKTVQSIFLILNKFILTAGLRGRAKNDGLEMRSFPPSIPFCPEFSRS